MNGLKEYYGELESLRFEVLIEDGYKKCRSLHHYFLPWQSVKEYEKDLEIKRREAENEIFLLSDSQQKIYFNRLKKFFDSLSHALQSITYQSNGEYLLKKDSKSLAKSLENFRLYNEEVGSCDSGIIFEDLQALIVAKAASVNKMLLKFPPEETIEPARNFIENTLDGPINKITPVLSLLFESDQVKLQMVESLRPFLSAGHAEYLSDLLEGKDVPGKIQFKGSTKQLGEFFKRMMYNHKILNGRKDEVEDWLCQNFLFPNSKTGTFQELKKNSVHYSISKSGAKLEAAKRIPASWMVYKTHSELKNEK